MQQGMKVRPANSHTLHSKRPTSKSEMPLELNVWRPNSRKQLRQCLPLWYHKYTFCRCLSSNTLQPLRTGRNQPSKDVQPVSFRVRISTRSRTSGSEQPKKIVQAAAAQVRNKSGICGRTVSNGTPLRLLQLIRYEMEPEIRARGENNRQRQLMR